MLVQNFIVFNNYCIILIEWFLNYIVVYNVYPVISVEPQISAALLGVYIEISVSPLITPTPLDEAVIKIVTIFY